MKAKSIGVTKPKKNNNEFDSYNDEEIVMVLFPKNVFEQIMKASKKMSMSHGELMSEAIYDFIEKNNI